MLVCVYVYVYIYIVYTDNGFFKVICLFFSMGKTTRTEGSLFGFCVICLEPPLGKSKCILIICDYRIIMQYDGYKYIHMYI